MRRAFPLFFLSSVAGIVLSLLLVHTSFKYPYSPSKISPLPEYAIMDLSGVLFGARRLVSDLAWIELLQYYGTDENGDSEEGEDAAHGHSHKVHYKYAETKNTKGYLRLYSYCNRVVQLDPFFSYGYLYGAGALAWNENRPEEALSLLESGVKNMEIYKLQSTSDPHQPYWQFNLYAAAIIYRKEGKFEEMISSLEFAVRQTACPNIVKAILANIYEQKKRFADALTLWINIYESNDPSYQNHSKLKIEELQKSLKI